VTAKDVKNQSGGRDPRIAPPSALAAAGATQGVRSDTLGNGIRVVSEHVPGVRSASLGIWVRQGSAHETPEQAGATHMLEHMVFKGSARRSAREIALSIESLGGSLDAYTTREHTAFQARVLDRHLPEALDVLADMALSPALREEDLALEREVVLEEIATVEDTPDDLVFDLHAERFWPGHPYGRPILGTRDSVASMSAAGLRELHGTRYRGANLVVAAAGNVEHEQLLTEVARRLGGLERGEPSPMIATPGQTAVGREDVERDTAQTHLVFAAPAVPHDDPRRYGTMLLSQAFGGGMSSRLFQRVREELGLAYTVFSFNSHYRTAGVMGVYVGTRPASAEQAADTVREELALLSRDGLSPDEFEQVREQVKGQLMLSLESTGARLGRLAGHALREEPTPSLDETLARFQALGLDEVNELAAQICQPERQFLLTLGPGNGSG